MRDAIADLRRTLGMSLASFMGLGLCVGLTGDLLMESLVLIPGVPGNIDWPRWLAHLGLAVFTGLAGWAGASKTLSRWRRRGKVTRLSTGEEVQPARWVVLAASPRRDGDAGPDLDVIRHHSQTGTTERLFILHTRGDAGEKAAERVRLAASAHDLEASLVPLPVRAADDPEPVFDVMEKLYEQARVAGLAEDEIVVDYTGGTKAITAGMVLAGAQQGRRLQALKPAKRLSSGQADRSAPSVCVEVDLRFDVRGLLPPVD
jgi:hypothetical protein